MAEKERKRDNGKLMTGLILLCCVVIYAIVKLSQPAGAQDETAEPAGEATVFTAQELFERASLPYGYTENPDGTFSLNRNDGQEAAKLTLDFDGRGVYGFLLSAGLPELPTAPKSPDILESAVYELKREDRRNAMEWLDETVSALLYGLDHAYSLTAGDKQSCLTLMHEAAEKQSQRSQTVGGFQYKVMPEENALHISMVLSEE